MSALVIAEHNNYLLRPVVQNVLTAANQLSNSVNVLIAGYQCDSVVKQLGSFSGITKILVADHKVYEHALAETLTPLIVSCLGNSKYILAPATTFGKNLLPRVAASLNVAQISDVLAILGQNTFQRPMYAGNAIATVKSRDELQVMTIRPTAFKASAVVENRNAERCLIDFVSTNSITQWVSNSLPSAEKPELTSSKIVIAGGRGVGSKENFARLMRIAESLGAAFGASRAAVDSGMVPNDLQIGQTGQIVAPEIYIAVGISGAIQHLAGMKDSGTIVAINSDPEAPIFQIADYGLVGDIEKILPEWEILLKEQTKKGN